MTSELAEALFALEAALPFVEAHVGTKMCSSAGSPASIKAVLNRHEWETERWRWIEGCAVQAPKGGSGASS